MVIRKNQVHNTPAQNRKIAQRQLAKDLRTGKPILPKATTSRARKLPKDVKAVVDKIQAIKERIYGDRPKWNAKRSQLAITRDNKTRRVRTLKELERILSEIEGIRRRRWDLGESLTEEEISDDVASALYYH